METEERSPLLELGSTLEVDTSDIAHLPIDKNTTWKTVFVLANVFLSCNEIAVLVGSISYHWKFISDEKLDASIVVLTVCYFISLLIWTIINDDIRMDFWTCISMMLLMHCIPLLLVLPVWGIRVGVAQWVQTLKISVNAQHFIYVGIIGTVVFIQIYIMVAITYGVIHYKRSKRRSKKIKQGQ
jgi:hypothetical protein